MACGWTPPPDFRDVGEEEVLRQPFDLGCRTDEQLRVYLDVPGECESWCCLAVDPEGRRVFREPGWEFGPETVVDDPGWSAEVERSDRGWSARVLLPLARLALCAGDVPRVMGINAMRVAAGSVSVWRPMVLFAVLPHRFGHLGLR